MKAMCLLNNQDFVLTNVQIGACHVTCQQMKPTYTMKLIRFRHMVQQLLCCQDGLGHSLEKPFGPRLQLSKVSLDTLCGHNVMLHFSYV